MALSKGLRLLRRLQAAGDSSVLLEARGRGDCLLFEAGTVATLGECARPRGAAHAGAAPQLSWRRGAPGAAGGAFPAETRDVGTSLPRGDRWGPQGEGWRLV